MKNLVWKPYISLELVIIVGIVMVIIILLNRKNIINRILIIIVLGIITQRPVLEKDSIVDTSMYDIMFVIDRSPSMNAVDVFNDTRLNAAKKNINTIKDKFSDAYFTILTYDEFSEILYPLTRELDIIDELIKGMDVISPDYISAIQYYSKIPKGRYDCVRTDITDELGKFLVALDYGSKLLKPYYDINDYLSVEKRDKNVKRLLFFISDGEINKNECVFERDYISEYKKIADLIDDGAVLGYGTEQGANIIIKQEMDESYKSQFVNERGYLLDGDGLAVSKYNEQNLKNLADNIGLEYIHVDDESKIDDLIERIQKDDETTKDDETERNGEIRATEWTDTYYYYVTVLLLLFMIELFHLRRAS